MTFECKLCGKDVEPTQAQDTFKVYGQAMCKTCTEKYLNGENNVRESEEDEATTPNPESTTPASSSFKSKDNKSIVPAKKSQTPARKTTNSSIVVQGYTREQIETIKNTVAKGATDSELQMFMHVAQTYGLDPFLKEIYYSNEMHTILSSRDGYLKAAMRDPNFDGVQSMAVFENDDFSIDAACGTVHHVFGKGDRGRIIGAWAIAYHKQRRPVIAFASFEEYAKNASTWKIYKSAMICKVAESFVLKRQFGLSGLVTIEEMGVEVV